MNTPETPPPGLVESLVKHAKLNYALDAQLVDVKLGSDEAIWIGFFRSNVEGRFEVLAQPAGDAWEFRRLISGANLSLKTLNEIRGQAPSPDKRG